MTNLPLPFLVDVAVGGEEGAELVAVGGGVPDEEEEEHNSTEPLINSRQY